MPDRDDRRAILVAWGIAAPLLLSWGLGTVHPILDLAAVPAALILGLPGLLGIAGCVLVVALAALGDRARGADRAAALIGALALLAHALAATRPLPWAALAVGLLAIRGRGRHAGPEPWPAAGVWGGVAAWVAASQLRPWGPGVPEGVLDAVGRAADAGLPMFGGEIAPVVAVAVGAWLLRRRAPADPRGALIGGALGLLAVATFGNGTGWGSAAAIGMLVGAWPIPLTWRPSRVVPALLIVCLLAGLRLGATERWRCEVAAADTHVRFWNRDADVQSVGVVPGNLPYVLLLRDGGARLERLATTGVISDAVTVEPAGGLLLSSGAFAPIVRAVGTDGGLLVEWWEAALLERVAAVETGRDCDPVGGRAVGDAAEVVCRGGAVVRVTSAGDGDARELVAPRALGPAGVGGTDFILRGGPLASVLFRVADRARVGPWTAGVGQSPARLLVGRGPAGHLELRGAGPPIGNASAPSPAAAIRRHLDRVRVGTWPGTPHYSRLQEAVYVTSPVDGRIHLVDPVVTWHQASVVVGPPPRQVVVDGPSGTLYGVNRCGVFEVRIRSVFPWRSSGDVEDHEKATEVPKAK